MKSIYSTFNFNPGLSIKGDLQKYRGTVEKSVVLYVSMKFASTEVYSLLF